MPGGIGAAQHYTRPMSMKRLLICLCCLAFLAPACDDGVPDDDDGPFGELDAILSEDRPTKRSEVVAVPNEATRSIVMFGGNDAPIVNQTPRSAFRDDTWVFEPGFGWTEVGGDGPSARGRYGASADAAGGRALLFGGRYRDADAEGTDPYTLYNDLWAFDFASRTWEMLDAGGGDAPDPRYYPGVVWSPQDEALYVYGGLTNTSSTNFQISSELFKWTDADGWSEIPVTGDVPSPRAFFGTTLDPARNRMILFAGQIGDFQSLAYNDLYALDLSSGAWEKLDNGGNGRPFTRMHPHLQFDSSRDRILLFGGHTDIGDDNDLWEFAGDGDRWEMVYEADRIVGERFGCLENASEVPGDYVEQDLSAPERRQKAMVALMFDNVWLFGGMHAECSEHLDDTWRYDLPTNTWTELIEARTGESCLRRNDDCDCLCL